MGYRLAGDRGREILRGAKITYSSPQVDQNAHAVQELQTSSDDTKKSFPENSSVFPPKIQKIPVTLINVTGTSTHLPAVPP